MTDLDSLIAEVGERAAFALAFQPDPVEGLRRAYGDGDVDPLPLGCGDPECCGEWEWVE